MVGRLASMDFLRQDSRSSTLGKPTAAISNNIPVLDFGKIQVASVIPGEELAKISPDRSKTGGGATWTRGERGTPPPQRLRQHFPPAPS